MSDYELPSIVTQPSEESDRRTLVPVIYIIVAITLLVIVSLLFTALLVFLASNYADTIVVIRDIFIIALGLMSCISGIVLTLLLIATIRLVNMLEYELKPILLQTNETLGTLRGTTEFVSDNVIRPVATASSYVAGFRRGISTLFGDPRRN